MLQPALNTPTQTIGHTTQTAPATYGALMASTRAAVDQAITVSNTRQPTAEAALEELRGYERFLHHAGNHLLLLTTLADLQSEAIRRLGGPLHDMGFRPASAGAWYAAATLLGTAHDLITTHLSGGAAPRTPEANQHLLGPGSAAACKNLTELIIDAVDASHELLRRARLTQKRRADRPISDARFYRLRATGQTVSICARATMWDLKSVSPELPAALDALEVAIPTRLTAAPVAVSVGNPLAAIRLLGQLCHDQARGLTSASPASLRDLALLGVRVHDRDLLDAYDEAGTDLRPLARLQRAHAADRIDAARAAWTGASGDLTTIIQGITRAPGAYGAAVRTLLTRPLEERTRATLAAMLPALGRDAARTVEALASRGQLVAFQPVPLQLRKAWRQITPEQGDVIAERFLRAGEMSSRALSATKDLQRTVAKEHPVAGPQPRQQRKLTRTVQPARVAQ